MFSFIAQFITYLATFFALESSFRTVIVPTFPKQAPDYADVQVFSFSVRNSRYHKDVIPIDSASLASDPSSWKVSTEERGTSVYLYKKNQVIVEQSGVILARFTISTHGFDTRIVLTTREPTNITCYGGGLSTPTSNDHVTVQVGNRFFYTAGGFLESIGLSLYMVNRNLTEKYETAEPLLLGAKLPLFWMKTDAKTHTFYSGGSDVDIYFSLSPKKRSRDYLKFLWGITGKPKVPPAFALGFHVSRWGWEDRAYISNVLDQFDIHGVPLDAFVMDFEWYLNITGGDYLIPSQGLKYYPDFRFGNERTFPDVNSQANEYRARNLKFGGIRKPRLGDFDLIADAHSKKWTLVRNSAKTRDLNFAIPEVREWYAAKTKEMRQQSQMLPDFFWNDEGETSYYTYHHWIEAQQLADDTSTTIRRFSLNRAFTPGMQRLEAAAVWTGDVQTTWRSLRMNIDTIVRWSEAGAPWVTFDIGGFDGIQDEGYPELLVRWYQVGAFVGVMRIHSTLTNVPHFPFAELWGNENAKAMKNAVQQRYKLLPTLLSAMYLMQKEGIPWIERKNVSSNEAAEDFLVNNRTLFIAPILSPMSENSEPVVILPEEAHWYFLDQQGPVIDSVRVKFMQIKLTDTLVFAREGSIQLLHGGSVDSSTRATELVGGGHTLLVKIFCHGSDNEAEFGTTLVEDDGNSFSGPNRMTTFRFSQKDLSLSWSAEGPADVPRWYVDLLIVMRMASGEEVQVQASLTSPVGRVSLAQGSKNNFSEA